MQPETPQQPQTPAPDSASTQPQPDTPPQSQVLDEASARQTPVVTMSMGEIALGSQGTSVDPAEEVEWQAQEYITTDKNPLWYAGLAIFVIAAVALDWFVLKTFFTVSLLAIVIAVVLVVMHVRPARMIHYKLDAEGLHVDGQLYPISDYKSFGVLHDGKENSVHLIPVKRFKPSLQVYFPVESGEAIVDSLGARLPMEELHLDFVDRIVHLFRL
jgi:hypothetical protein